MIDYCYERKPGTVTNLLNDLNWHSLELRRKIAQLTTVNKIVNNKIRVNIPECTARSTRVTRSYHSSKFINIGSNSNTYKYNLFFTRTLKEWNTLPSFLLDQPSVDAFKSAVTYYFNLPHWFYTSFYFIIYLLPFLLLFFFHSFTVMGNLCETGRTCFETLISVHNRRFMSKARWTRQFARSARRGLLRVSWLSFIQSQTCLRSEFNFDQFNFWNTRRNIEQCHQHTW